MKKNERPLKHMLYPRHLETHVYANLPSDWLEINLKINALFYRGIVIADSDLNNNPNLQQFFFSKNKLFAEGIKSGFISRVARYKNETGGPISQVELYKEFLNRAKGRAVQIPEQYPEELDTLFSKAEKTQPPHIWKLSQLSTAFAQRILLEFLCLQKNSKEAELTSKILEYTDSFKEGGYEGLFGSKIEEIFLPNHSEDQEQKEIWKRILTAYGGNILSVFGGDIIVGEFGGIPPIKLPSGPNADQNDIKTVAIYYNAQKNLVVNELFKIGVNQISPSRGQDASYMLNLDKLMDLPLNKIEELRESCDPGNFFDLRSSILASEDNLESKTLQLSEATNTFWENLCSKGFALTEKENKKVIDQISIRLSKKEVENELKLLGEDERKLLADTVKTCISLVPPVSIYCSLLDFIELAKEGGEMPLRKESLAHDIHDHGQIYSKNSNLVNDILRYSQKRIDFKVVEKVNDYLLQLQ